MDYIKMFFILIAVIPIFYDNIEKIRGIGILEKTYKKVLRKNCVEVVR